MNKKAEKYGLMVLAVVAVVAVIGLVTYFGNQTVVGALTASDQFVYTDWTGTVVTKGQAAYRDAGFTSELAYHCAMDVTEWAESLEDAKAAKEAAVECGKCCSADEDVSRCARECTGYTGGHIGRLI